jgi:hypothetical protein
MVRARVALGLLLLGAALVVACGIKGPPRPTVPESPPPNSIQNGTPGRFDGTSRGPFEPTRGYADSGTPGNSHP